MVDFIEMITTKCSCLTKTPDIEYHQEDCTYRVARETYYQDRKEIDESMKEYKNLTIKEIDIIFQHTYDLQRVREHLYSISSRLYDVYEDIFEEEILIRFADSPNSSIVTSAKGLYN